MTGEQHDREVRLAETFVRLADSLVGNYDVVDLLDGLTRTCVALLDISAAGLLLTDQRAGLRLLASSSEDARLLEVFQLQSERGPCLDCFQSGQAVTVPDLAAELDRWPQFVPVAAGHGFRAVHALPLRLREQTIGALNLFNAEPRTLSEADTRIAQALADVATIGILQQRTIHHGAELAEQLQTALNTRTVIEQAKGVLVERGSIDMDRAFALLRSYSRAHNRRLAEVALAIGRRELAPDEVLRQAVRTPAKRTAGQS